jgi:hypothetical protein
MENNTHHVLIANCKSSPSDTLKPVSHGDQYLVPDGLWANSQGKSTISDTKRPRPMTKKNDVETGEDQKGQ